MSATQQIFRVRRNYNRWVANQTLEDYALRFTAKRSRYWSAYQVAMTALGATAFLALEAIGGAITLNYGFTNAFIAIVVVSVIIFSTGLPISYYASLYGVDIDLLTRGAGFGYLGSTLTSLIYASFTFIFFAIEAAILSSALEALFSIPLYIGYIISAVIVIPIVTHGITFISRFQIFSQPIWLSLQIIAIFAIVYFELKSFDEWINFNGVELTLTESKQTENSFNLLFFGAASSVLFAMMAQIGEQVDYLRFLPTKNKTSPTKWWFSMLLAGPGWIFIGIIKLFVGSFLAYLAFTHGLPTERAADPTYMYEMIFSYITNSSSFSLTLAVIMVITCQLKINVTNAYAGSLAWSNFFSRLTYNHPGRVVWLVFNVAIALLLMELGIYRALENILGVFAIVAVAWLGTIATDLTVNKYLGLAPKGIEFKRAHLYDINPVGIGSLLISSTTGFVAYLGILGEEAHALTHYITLLMTILATPLIAWVTKGKYYIARSSTEICDAKDDYQCCICELHYEPEDMSYCPAYQGNICSLCCSLDSRCMDGCKENSRFSEQLFSFFSLLLPKKITSVIHSRLIRFIGILTMISVLNGMLMALIYSQVTTENIETLNIVADTLWVLFFVLFIISGVLAWLFLLAHESRIVAQEESQRQTTRLMKEIEAHTQTDQALQKAIEQAQSASKAKTRYLSGISHELRSPLQTILGYAQLLSQNKSIPKQVRESITIIQRSGDYLADLIEGLLDFSKIEAGKLDIRRDEIDLHALMNQLELMFRPQAESKDLNFIFTCPKNYPKHVIGDEKRIRQILINLLSNAIKFTSKGSVQFSFSYRNQVAKFKVKDTGIGIAKEHLEQIFYPFERITHPNLHIAGTGLGLTIVHLLTDIMGGDISVDSDPDQGSEFTASLMLSRIDIPISIQLPLSTIIGYIGMRKTIFVVDDQPSHRTLLKDLLTPLGFNIVELSDAKTCLDLLVKKSPNLFLIDLSMPDMDGLTLATLLRRRKIDVPIIMLSADAQEHHSIDDPLAPHDFYMVKPINFQQLLDKLGILLKLKWRYQQGEQSLKQNTSEKEWHIPDHPYITQLIAFAEIGYAKGFNDQLVKADHEGLLTSELVQHLYQLVKQVRFDKISKLLNKSS